MYLVKRIMSALHCQIKAILITLWGNTTNSIYYSNNSGGKEKKQIQAKHHPY